MQDEIRQSGRSGRAGLHAGKPRTLHVNAGAFPLNVPVGYNVLHATTVVLMAVFLEDERMIRKSNRGPASHVLTVRRTLCPRPASRSSWSFSCGDRHQRIQWCVVALLWFRKVHANTCSIACIAEAQETALRKRVSAHSNQQGCCSSGRIVHAVLQRCGKNPITGQTLRIGTAQKIRTRR